MWYSSHSWTVIPQCHPRHQSTRKDRAGQDREDRRILRRYKHQHRWDNLTDRPHPKNRKQAKRNKSWQARGASRRLCCLPLVVLFKVTNRGLMCAILWPPIIFRIKKTKESCSMAALQEKSKGTLLFHCFLPTPFIFRIGFYCVARMVSNSQEFHAPDFCERHYVSKPSLLMFLLSSA